MKQKPRRKRRTSPVAGKMTPYELLQVWLMEHDAPSEVAQAWRYMMNRIKHLEAKMDRSVDRYLDDGTGGVQPDALQHFIDTYNHTLDTLPDPEDLIAENELRFVGYFLMIREAHWRFAQATTRASESGQTVPAFLLDRESALEQWLDLARDYLPEWADPDRESE